MTTKKKLIEVALPLDAINAASVRESYIYRGNPSALHKWWAQRPLAAARAVIFAQMVDDPCEYVDVLLGDTRLRRAAEKQLRARLAVWKEAVSMAAKAGEAGLAVPEPGPEPSLEEIAAEIERERLFDIIRDLVVWENTTNEAVMQAARDEIWQSWRRTCAENADHPRAQQLFDRKRLPAFHDPFAGGGTLPLEAQRLGLESNASDLNPVAVLINKAMIEIPPRFAGRPPVNPEARNNTKLFTGQWKGAQGLAEDVRYYGEWVREQAEQRIGHLYPKVEITTDMTEDRPDLKRYVGQKLTAIAWLWARTVRSPNPAFADVYVPLASTFLLSTRAGREAYVEPVVEDGTYRFTVKMGAPTDVKATKSGTKLSRGANFQCVMSRTPITGDYIKAEGTAGRIGARLMAVVVEGEGGRTYVSPVVHHELSAAQAEPSWRPEGGFVSDPRAFTPCLYGITEWHQVFTTRQLAALTVISDLIGEAGVRVEAHARAAIEVVQDSSGSAVAYAEALRIYLAFCLSKVTDYNCSLVPWYTKEDRPGHLFSQQVLPMVWDYVELNPFSGIGGSWSASVSIVAGALNGCAPYGPTATVSQLGAIESTALNSVVISTDPPYYDNVPYADLSDFFYVWLRRSLRASIPDLFATMAVPKLDEIVALPYRHDFSQDRADKFFLEHMEEALARLAARAHPAFPLTVYYAFRQSETDRKSGTVSTGWQTFLEAVVRAKLTINGTWPMRTERTSRSRGIGSNALATSVVLVCRRRDTAAPVLTRREFIGALRLELPAAVTHLQRANIAPVDLAQAALGPGMAVYSRAAAVLDADGKPLSVREALRLINSTLDEVAAEQEGDFDADSRWALTWFDQMGFAEGEYGLAEQLSKSKNTSVGGMVQAGIVSSKSSRVRLLKPDELPADWDPVTDPRLTAWEMVHQLIRALEADGEGAAAALVAKLGAKAEVARELCYRLYTLCERKKRATEALSYNGLVQSWPEIVRLARAQAPPESPTIPGLF